MGLTQRNTTERNDRFPLLWAFLNLFHGIYAALWSAFWIIAALLARLVTRGTGAPLAMARRFWAPGLLRAGGMRVEVKGLENLDPSQSYFFAVNHQSMLDVVVLYDALPVPLLFIVKEELRRVPLLGQYMSAMGMIYIRRQDRRRSLDAMQLCAQRLAEGRNILIFPEGTRSPDGLLGPFKPGAFVPPIDAGAPVVPVAIDGTGKVLPPGGFRIRPGKIRLAVGRPIATDGFDREKRRELARNVRGQIVELLDQRRL